MRLQIIERILYSPDTVGTGEPVCFAEYGSFSFQGFSSYTGPLREQRGPGKKISSAKQGQNSEILCSRCGNKLTVLVPRAYMHVEVYFYTNHPLLKALLIILLKRSLIESKQCNGKRKKKK